MNDSVSLTTSAADGVLANDVDPNNLTLSAVLVSGPTNGVLELNADGSFVYTPNPGFVGNDTFSYEATDASGLYSNPATATIAVSNDTIFANGFEEP